MAMVLFFYIYFTCYHLKMPSIVFASSDCLVPSKHWDITWNSVDLKFVPVTTKDNQNIKIFRQLTFLNSVRSRNRTLTIFVIKNKLSITGYLWGEFTHE